MSSESFRPDRSLGALGTLLVLVAIDNARNVAASRRVLGARCISFPYVLIQLNDKAATAGGAATGSVCMRTRPPENNLVLLLVLLRVDSTLCVSSRLSAAAFARQRLP